MILNEGDYQTTENISFTVSIQFSYLSSFLWCSNAYDETSMLIWRRTSHFLDFTQILQWDTREFSLN